MVGTRIKSKIVPKHILVVDTNELWQEAKTESISDTFEIFWQEHNEKYLLELMIPEVVLGELLFQHTSNALKTLERTNNQFESMSRVTGKKYRHSITAQKLKKDIEVKFDAWVRSKAAQIIKTPIKDIDWSNLIDKAIWRRKPFTEDPKIEKGFRDSLILETLKFIAKNDNVDVVFVTRDSVLREAAIIELDKHLHVTCFESLEEFSSHLKLLDEKLTANFIKSIQKTAREKFFNVKNGTGLIISKEVIDLISDNFKNDFLGPETEEEYLLGGHTMRSWNVLCDEMRIVKSPNFVRREKISEYYWSSDVLFVQAFEYVGVARGLLARYKTGQKNIRILSFSVEWRAHVSVGGRFSKLELINIKLHERKFEPPTQDEIQRYRMDRYFMEGV